MRIDMIDVGVELVRMQRQVGMRDRESLILVLVGMRVLMDGAVTVRVGVHCVGVVVVSGLIRVGNVSVILIRVICVIAMAAIQMIYVGHIQVVLVLGGLALVVVIAMAHIPVVRVRRVLKRAIQMARAGEVVMISVGGGVAVIPMELDIEVIGMPGVGVVIEREITMRVGVIAMIGMGVSVTVEMRRRRIRMVLMRVGVIVGVWISSTAPIKMGVVVNDEVVLMR